MLWSRRASIVMLVMGAVASVWFWQRWSRRLNYWELTNPSPANPTILCYGDSLVAGFGADDPQGTYPVQLGKILGVEVIASGVPGETSEGGWKRLQATRGRSFGVAVVTLGGNDILQRVPWETTQKNLSAIFQEFQSRGALVLFTAVEGPFGGRQKRYRQLCREKGVVMVPDILKGILGNPDLTADPIHPNSAGYRLVAERVAKAAAPFLGRRMAN